MTTFVVGQKVRILEDRRMKNFHPSELSDELTIHAIDKANIHMSGHAQLLHTDKGTYSGYWFDPDCPVLDKLKNSE